MTTILGVNFFGGEGAEALQIKVKKTLENSLRNLRAILLDFKESFAQIHSAEPQHQDVRNSTIAKALLHSGCWTLSRKMDTSLQEHRRTSGRETGADLI